MYVVSSVKHTPFILQLRMCIMYVVSSVKHTPFISSTTYVYYVCSVVSQTHTVHFFNYVCVLCMWYRQSNTHLSFPCVHFLNAVFCVMCVVWSVRLQPRSIRVSASGKLPCLHTKLKHNTHGQASCLRTRQGSAQSAGVPLPLIAAYLLLSAAWA